MVRIRNLSALKDLDHQVGIDYLSEVNLLVRRARTPMQPNYSILGEKRRVDQYQVAGIKLLVQRLPLQPNHSILGGNEGRINSRSIWYQTMILFC